MPTINRGFTFDYDVYQEWKLIIDRKRLKQSNVLQGHIEFDINKYREEQRNKELTLQPLTINDIDKKLSKSAIGSIFIINNDNETEKNKDRDKEVETIVNHPLKDPYENTALERLRRENTERTRERQLKQEGVTTGNEDQGRDKKEDINFTASVAARVRQIRMENERKKKEKEQQEEKEQEIEVKED